MQIFMHDPGCTSLNNVVKFVQLLLTICQYLCTSEDIQSHYLSIPKQAKLREHGQCGEDF